jgi:hypothetical protein
LPGLCPFARTNSNSAEFGRYSGGVINIYSKSGTNQFHGSAYEYFRITDLNANLFFSNAEGLGKTPFHQNQYGLGWWRAHKEEQDVLLRRLGSLCRQLQSAKRYGARNAIFHPVVIREKDTVKACFHIAFVAADGSKPYAMVPLEVPTETLDELAISLIGASSRQGDAQHRNPMLSRLDVLEQQVTALRSALD